MLSPLKMIQPNKQQNALLAMNAILVLCRKIALDSGHSEIYTAMDIAEYLVMLMLEADDTTQVFREQLVGLSERNPKFAHALMRFDRDAG